MFVASIYDGVPYVLVTRGITVDAPMFVPQYRVAAFRASDPLTLQVTEDWKAEVDAFRARCTSHNMIGNVADELCRNAYPLNETDARHARLIREDS